jgi:uncharacterized protein with von Willebrand factor type A (vWA) domain
MSPAVSVPGADHLGPTPGLEAWAASSSTELIDRVVTFARRVRRAGIDTGPAGAQDAVRSLAAIDLADRQQFYTALRANLLNRVADIPAFDALFESFWLGTDGLGESGEERRGPDLITADTAPAYEVMDESAPEAQQERRETLSDQDDAEPADASPALDSVGSEPQEEQGPEREEEVQQARYSPLEVLAAKDFSRMNDQELREIQRLVLKLRPRLFTVWSRRYEPRHRRESQLDFRRTFRRWISDGDLIRLSWRRRRIQKARVVLLCDVSRSMDKYSQLLIQFMYVIANVLSGTETLTFSTRLTRITELLEHRSADEALLRLADEDAAWSSGTSIGTCLAEFNRLWAPRLVDRRTVCVILSDGWDQGNVKLLAEQVQAIKRKCHMLIWLNPMMGDPEYAPVCSGMRAALPHIDHLLPCHNLASLSTFAERLARS